MATPEKPLGSANPSGGDSKDRVICPHCWHEFSLDDILAVARHQEMVGDPVLGPEAPQRFLPSRFTPDGHAIDAHGIVCPDHACPRCHLVIPHPLTERPPIFVSMIGAPGSGKSYLLTSMMWELRNVMPGEFAFAFGDADSTCNEVVNEYERTLFMCADDEALVTLEKTEMQGRMYNQVLLDNMPVTLPRPLMFSLVPQPFHVWYRRKKDALKRTIVMYDNAGEHFEPGMDSPSNPGTQHLLMSHGLFFLFDPTKDSRFRSKCKSDDPQIQRGARVERQEILLTETATRLKRYDTTWRDQKYSRPLIVVVTKCDIWQSLLKHPLPEPWRRLKGKSCSALDLDAIMVVSFAVRHLLARTCPEMVSTAETFASKVIYLPVSALGRSPETDPENPESGLLLVRPRDIQPIWATMPMLSMFALFGLIPAAGRKQGDELPQVTDYQAAEDRLFLTVPGTQQNLEVPLVYLGRPMRCPETGKWFRLPSAGDLRRAGGLEAEETL